MIKLFISDLDGTLINRQLEIEEHNVAAMQKAMDAGILIGIATGRMAAEINQLMSGSFQQPVYAIAQNGATVYSTEKELLSSETFDAQLAYQIIQVGNSYPELVNIVQTADDIIYIKERTIHTSQYEKRMLIPSTELVDLEEKVADPNLLCSKMMYLGDIHQLKEFEAQLNHQFSGMLETCISYVDCLDITPRHISKGNALLQLMDRLGISADEVACIGDSYNDVSMFQVAKHSYAMSHSDDAIKQHASKVVHSVAEAIEDAMKQYSVV